LFAFLVIAFMGLAFMGLAFMGLAFMFIAFMGLAFIGLAFMFIAFIGLAFAGLAFVLIAFTGEFTELSAPPRIVLRPLFALAVAPPAIYSILAIAPTGIAPDELEGNPIPPRMVLPRRLPLFTILKREHIKNRLTYSLVWPTTNSSS
jgi:hypothetical protein